MIRKNPTKLALIEFENADTVCKVVNWYYDHCSWIHPKLVLDKFIPHFISQGKTIKNTGEKWKIREEHEQFEFFQKKMEEHLQQKKVMEESVEEYNTQQKQKGDDDLPTLIEKMKLEPPSPAMEKKAKEVEYKINTIKQDKIDKGIQDVVQEGFDIGQKIILEQDSRLRKDHKKSKYYDILKDKVIKEEEKEEIKESSDEKKEEQKGTKIVELSLSQLYKQKRNQFIRSFHKGNKNLRN